jgi:hypothetical protein
MNTWKKPELRQIEMNAEVRAYQADAPGLRPSRACGPRSGVWPRAKHRQRSTREPASVARR